MKNLEAILWPLAIMVGSLSLAVLSIVHRSLPPWWARWFLKRWAPRDERERDLTVGPIHIVERPPSPPTDQLSTKGSP